MNAFDKLEHQLRHATIRQARRRRRWPARLAVGCAAVVLVGAPAIAATHPWSPVLGNEHNGHPTAATHGVPAAEVAVLGILRRPQSAADRSVGVQRLLKVLTPDVDHGIHVDAIRLLARQGDIDTILLPIAREGVLSPGVAPSKTMQRNALCVLTTFVPPPDAQHLPGVPLTGWSMKCGTLHDLLTGRLVSPGPLYGLVPDGVATVKLRVRGGRTLTARVKDNFYDLRDQSSTAGLFAIQPPKFFDAAGREIPKRR